MNILFVTNDLYPNLNATSGIAYNIARILHDNYQCKVTVLGFDRKDNKKKQVIKDPDWIKTIHMHSISVYYNNSYGNIFARSFKWFKNIDTILFKIKLFLKQKNIIEKEYQKYIKRAISRERYDCIIGFSNPVTIPIALTTLKTNIPIILYKLDPWHTYSTVINNNAEAIELENNADNKASAIITSASVLMDYIKYGTQFQKEKYYPVEFPYIVKENIDSEAELYDRKKINCVFLGGLYKNIRSPEYTLNLFNELKDDNICFHIFGYQVYGKSLPEVLPENVIYHGNVSSEIAKKNMYSADILVNIGNTVLNQLPSKLFNYISTGKPILNIIKNVDCPTIPYMKKYPLALTVLETETPTGEDIDRIRHFIIDNKDKKIQFDKIEKLFFECTPEYVGGKVYEIIEKNVKENRKS